LSLIITIKKFTLELVNLVLLL